MNDSARAAGKALFKTLATTMPRVGYRGDGTVPQLAHMQPVRNSDNGNNGFLLMDALERTDAAYIRPLEIDATVMQAIAEEGTGVRGFLTSALQSYHAEWN